jgi:hypothetical protein
VCSTTANANIRLCVTCCRAQVGSVIRSPEMAALVPALLSAIADPNASTRSCLDTLLATTFVNTIDAPSLALVVPVVHRGLRDRSGDTKKRAARIVGNMCSLTNDPKVPTPPLLLQRVSTSLLSVHAVVCFACMLNMVHHMSCRVCSVLQGCPPWRVDEQRFPY